jgi:hypothetical protein
VVDGCSGCTCGRQGYSLARRAGGTGLVLGSRCSCKQLVAIVSRVQEETEGRGRFRGRAYE